MVVPNTLPLGGLGYVGIHAPDPHGWREFATRVCGLEPALMPPAPRPQGIAEPRPEAEGVSADGTVFLKMDRRQWRLAIHPGEQPGLAYLGFELTGEPALEAAMESISARGVEIRPATEEECALRGVGRFAVLADPAGHRLELFCRPTIDQPMRGTSEILSLIHI